MTAVISTSNSAQLLQQNIAEAALREKHENDYRQKNYEDEWDNWFRNKDIRVAQGLVALPEPQPDLVYHRVFDPENWMTVTHEGPDRLPATRTVPPPPPAPPAVSGKLGKPFQNDPDVCLTVPGEKSSIGTVITFNGRKWKLFGVPFTENLPYKWVAGNWEG